MSINTGRVLHKRRFQLPISNLCWWLAIWAASSCQMSSCLQGSTCPAPSLRRSVSSLASPPASAVFPGDEARLVEQIIYSCLSPDSALYRREMRDGKNWGKEEGTLLFSFHVMQKTEANGWQLQLARSLSSLNMLQHTKHTLASRLCERGESKFLSSEAQKTCCLNLCACWSAIVQFRRLIRSHKLSAELFSA